MKRFIIILCTACLLQACGTDFGSQARHPEAPVADRFIPSPPASSGDTVRAEQPLSLIHI